MPGPGVVKLATSMAAGDAVVIRDVANSGRIVQLSTAGNSAIGTWGNVSLQKLVINSVNWAPNFESCRRATFSSRCFGRT